MHIQAWVVHQTTVKDHVSLDESFVGTPVMDKPMHMHVQREKTRHRKCDVHICIHIYIYIYIVHVYFLYHHVI